MALEPWLIKLKTAISNALKPRNKKRPNIEVLAFEISGLMSKILHLWQSLSPTQITHLRNEAIAHEGVRKLVSNDDGHLLGLACAEMAETLRLAAGSISRLCKRCDDLGLRTFDRFFDEFANSGQDSRCWVMTRKEMEKTAKKMTQFVSATSELHKEMEDLSEMESGLKRLLDWRGRDSPPPVMKIKRVAELQQKLLVKREAVDCLKESSLWSKSFDTVVLILARSCFTVLSRIKHVFGVGHEIVPPSSLPRTFSTSSAAVHPSENSSPCKFISEPLASKPGPLQDCGESIKDPPHGFFFFSNTDVLKPPPSTLGAVALALHYANLIIVIEKMVRSPHLIGVDARDDLYGMLPASLRLLLRKRLRGVGYSASDPALAGDWREALRKILEWLSPLAHNMIRWQSERSLEQQKVAARPATGVLLLQTMYFANKEKTEAAIAELLVGLNYIWRFEREMNAKVLLECSNALLELQGNGS